MPKKKIIVAGGGIAGLTASFYCAKAGFETILIEKRKILGGRVYSAKDYKTGDEIDNGQHVLTGAYKTFLGFLEDIGSGRHLYKQRALKVIFRGPGQLQDTLNAGLLPGKAGLLAGLAAMKHISPRDKAGAVKFLILLRLGRINGDSLSSYDLLKKYNQDGGIYKRFWEPLILAAINLPPEEAGAGLLISVLDKAFFAGKENSGLIIPQTGLSEMLAPFEDKFKSMGGRIIQGMGAESLIFKNGRCAGARLIGGETLSAGAVIAALPAYGLKKILPADIADNKYFSILNRIQYSPIVSNYIWAGRDIFDFDFAAMLGANIQWIFNKRKIAPPYMGNNPEFPSYFTLTVSGAEKFANLPAVKINEICRQDLIRLYPEFSEVNILHTRLMVDKRATFKAGPEIEKIRPAQKSPFPGLFLAGDWTNTGLPATIEGASLSGKLAASHAANGIFLHT